MLGSLLHWRRWWRQDQRDQAKPLHFQEAASSLAVVEIEPAAPATVAPLDFTPWSIARLEAISREVQERPSASALLAARSARHCLSRFWLTAPVDSLEALFDGPIGQVYRRLLAGVLPALSLDPSEAAWKQQLTNQLQLGFDHDGSVNVFLALLPYLDREVMQVSDPLGSLPAWLIPLYAERCEPGLRSQSPKSVPQLPAVAPLAPTVPDLAPITGAAGMALIGDTEFLGRVNGLIKLYELEPSDPEICHELCLGRRQIAQVWLDVETEQLEELHRTPFGQVTDHLILSGFAREPLSDDDRVMRQQLAELSAHLEHPRALNALMAALLYYPIEQVTMPADLAQLPAWLTQSLTTLGVRPEPG